MKKTNIILTSKHNGRPFLADATYIESGRVKPVILFNHGFKGFKDWGPFSLMAEEFARAGFVFVKMNFSHNGTTTEQPTEFADLEAFAQNNFSMELDDTGVLIDHLFSKSCEIPGRDMDLQSFFLMGHSRGGASAILKASGEPRIKKLATWAAVNNLETYFSNEEVEYWRQTRRIYIQNARTNQQMPMDFQIVENFLANKQSLQVPEAVKNITVPMLAIHGSADSTVPVHAARQMKTWNDRVEIEIIEGADHTFGGTHPFNDTQLPVDLKQAVDKTASFFLR
ncbi:MAG: alpha/beta hydrolase [Cyclobacteriaceae bacterium]|nr:alpha/beta hydrolase [Cyclobacteriaceae bacterium]